jgi:hypothetical protein
MPNYVNCPQCGKELGEGVTRCWTTGCDFELPTGSFSSDTTTTKTTTFEKKTTLTEDLSRYAGEFYSKGDLQAGKKLLIEIGGMITIGGFVLSAATVWLPAVGVTLSTYTIARLIFHVGTYYNKATEAQRKQIRAAIKWIKNGFNLDDQLVDE